MEATTYNNPLHKRQGKDRALILDLIRRQVEKGRRVCHVINTNQLKMFV